MRVMRNILCSLCAALLFVSCEGDVFETIIGDNSDHDAVYVGDVVVDQNDGTTYTKNEVEVSYTLNDDGTLDIFMKKVKFAQAMPAINMEIPNVAIVDSGSMMTLSGDGIVPIAMGGKFEKYTITKLAGSISKAEMSLSFICGEYPVTYLGERISVGK